jgi:2-iminobutanoate/2-iminopropanoate deaminase
MMVAVFNAFTHRTTKGTRHMRRSSGLSLLVVSCLTSLSACTTAPDTSIRAIAVPDAPKAAGPYSQGTIANGFLFTSGQVPRDPATGKAVEGDITVQANRLFDNLEAILRGGGCTLKDVVKVSVFLTDLADSPKLNEVFSARFGNHRPARSTVQVSKLPSNSILEMDLIARVPR